MALYGQGKRLHPRVRPVFCRIVVPALNFKQGIMRIVRLVISDLHLGTGIRRATLNPLEDFLHDEDFADLLAFYDEQVGTDGQIELVFNGDIFDLLKVRVAGRWPTDITEEVAVDKLRQCLEGHPRFVIALRSFLSNAGRSLVYLPGNHDLDMWFPAPQELLRRYIAPSGPAERVRFVTATDTYYLPEGVQIRHGHQLERIHRVDYSRLTRRRQDGQEVLNLPWGSLWILEVMNPAKMRRSHVDRIQPLRRFLLGAAVFDPVFAITFVWRTIVYFLKHRVFNVDVWGERLRRLPNLLREEVIALGGFDEAAHRALRRLRGVQYLIVGHSHGPRFQQLPDGKVLVNTGTWMHMINLDLQHLGQDSGLTYCLIEYEEGKPNVQLLRWRGANRPFEVIPYAD